MNDDLTFYDEEGTAVAYTRDAEAIYLFSGEPVAYLSDESIYAYSGKHLGFFLDGWVRDHDGRCVFYTEDARGGPARPARQARPARSARQSRPARGAREARPARAARQSAWSRLSGPQFFTET